MTTSKTPRSVLITGATGNLGQKMVEALARTSWCERIVGIDRHVDQARFSAEALSRLHLIQGDLTQAQGAWREGFRDVDAVIHFAAANPLPDSTWEEAMASCDMTLNLLQASLDHSVKRFVFASSNHAMGAYKDQPLAADMGPGRLTTDLPPAPGTRWFDGSREVHSFAYGSSKIMSEKLCATVAQASGGALSCVSVRVGWVLPGANDPRDITHSGAPSSTASLDSLNDEERRTLRWFRDLWLSNDDLHNLFIAALCADAATWPAAAVVVNGVSANAGTVWDLQSARDCLGYEPVDDVYRQLA
ncbi:NAD-dependent epimerase/dehydratase family protein [Pseudomonas sp. NPDC090202]|uniref:NAD-dependent epimerase/dehydratase family protein n=1 Tax=unclassified Pseudomonas TaxID=196821 RepID=UPI0037F76FC2